jgi:cell division protein FtsB
VLKRAIWLFLISFVLLIIFLPGYSRLQELRQKNKELEAKIEAVQQENSALRHERERLEKDIVYLERVAREKMGLIREGEIIYKIIPENKD